MIVGNNTAGKTALVQAVLVSMGAYLQSLDSLPPGRNYHRNFMSDDVLKRYNRAKKDYFENEEKTLIATTADFTETINDAEDGQVRYVPNRISWWRAYTGSTTTHSLRCAGELIDAVKRMEARRKSEDPDVDAVYPVVLLFGADRLDNQYKTAQKTKERASRIAKAYKGALADSTDFKSAFDWLYRYGDNIRMGTEFEGTREAFLEALQTAIPSLSDIIVNAKDRELYAQVSVRGRDPQYQGYHFMSDGFKSVINIVSEIAYRSILLNGHLGRDAVRLTPGVVLIDEVELYLHPRWQRHFLEELTSAFPKIQFIVTTHSPFIIQSVRKQNIITLDGINDDTDPIYRSIEEIAEKEMNMDGMRRSRRYEEMLDVADEYFEAVKNMGSMSEEKLNSTKQRLDDMEAQFSYNPAYVALLQYQRSKQEDK